MYMYLLKYLLPKMVVKNILIDLPSVRFFFTKMSEKSKHYYSCLDLQYAKDDNSYVKKKIKCKKNYQKQRLTVEHSAKIIHEEFMNRKRKDIGIVSALL